MRRIDEAHHTECSVPVGEQLGEQRAVGRVCVEEELGGSPHAGELGVAGVERLERAGQVSFVEERHRTTSAGVVRLEDPEGDELKAGFGYGTGTGEHEMPASHRDRLEGRRAKEPVLGLDVLDRRIDAVELPDRDARAPIVDHQIVGHRLGAVVGLVERAQPHGCAR